MRGWLLAFAVAVALSGPAVFWAQPATRWVIGRRGYVTEADARHSPPEVRPIVRSVTRAATAPGRIYAIDSTGRLTAHSNDGSLLWTPPLVAQDLVAAEDGVVVRLPDGVVALDPEGNERWRIATARGVDQAAAAPGNATAMALSATRLVYVLSDRLRAHDRQTGREVWSLETPIRSLHTTAAGDVIVGTRMRDRRRLLRDDGTLEPLPDWFDTHTATAPGGLRVVGSGLFVHVRDAHGVRWRQTLLGDRGMSGAAVLPDGTAIIATEYVYGFGPTGMWRWRLDPYGDVTGAPVRSQGIVYVATDRMLAAFDRDGVLWTRHRSQDRVDPHILLATDEGAPVFLHRTQHDGRPSPDLWVGGPPRPAGGR